MQEFVRFQLVKSKAGHDKDNIYVIYSFDKEYVYLVDGKLKKIANPKKKKKKHVQAINYVDAMLNDKFESNKKIIDEEIKYAIKQYMMLKDE